MLFLPDLGLKYQEISTTSVNAFRLAIQKLTRKTPTVKSKILSVLHQCLKSRPTRQLIVIITDNNPDDSTSVSQIFPDIDVTKIQVRNFNKLLFRIYVKFYSSVTCLQLKLAYLVNFEGGIHQISHEQTCKN